MFNPFKKGLPYGTGALRDPLDIRDLRYESVAAVGEPIDWEKGYDVEKDHPMKIPIKNQNGSGSCVGQGWSYYVAVLNTLETGYYDEVSAKGIYSLICLGLPGGGAYIRDGGKLIVDFGALLERIVPSYDNGKPPSEDFMRNKIWKSPEMTKLATVLQAKEYRTFGVAQNMEMFAMAIRDNDGVVGGVEGSNNGTWNSFEPQPPIGHSEWGHCLYFGKFGIDSLGKYIATPNSWGYRGSDTLHPDGWQKLRQNWFDSVYMFNPWTLSDKPNAVLMSEDAQNLIKRYEKKFIVEGQGAGRKGIIVGGQLRPVRTEREAAAAIYVQTNSGYGATIPTTLFDELPKGANF
jgi:hypothetical protein